MESICKRAGKPLKVIGQAFCLPHSKGGAVVLPFEPGYYTLRLSVVVRGDISRASPSLSEPQRTVAPYMN